MQTLIYRLEDPFYEAALVLLVILSVAIIRAGRKGKLTLRPAFATVKRAWRNETGSSQLTQQAISQTITTISVAFSIALIGYAVIQMTWTAICGHNLAEIGGAEDLRFSRGYGYTTNGNVTAAAFVDADGNNDYLKTDPHDPAAPKGTFYTFTATVVNGDTTYTVDDPATASHASWTLSRETGYAANTTHQEYDGPGGTTIAK